MSRTSLGQRQQNQASSLRQLASVRRMNYQQQFTQTRINMIEEVQFFLHMKEKYLKLQKQSKFMNFQSNQAQSFSTIKDGFGINVLSNGDRYMGYWQNNMMQGMGIYLFRNLENKDRIAYLGEFHQCRFNGLGKLIRMEDQVNGEIIYNGSWSYGEKSNNGLYFYQNPNIYYQGNWVKDQRSGEGKMIFPNGEYVGQWLNNVKHGQGKLRKNEKNVIVTYEGFWTSDNLNEGDITYSDASGSEFGRYRGQILNGKRHGLGKYTIKTSSYQGNFQQDRIKGDGTIQGPNFSINGFFYPKGDLIESAQNLKALINYSNKDIFDGIVAINKGKVVREKGLYKFLNGDSAQGVFIDNDEGKLQGNYRYRWRNGQEKNF